MSGGPVSTGAADVDHLRRTSSSPAGFRNLMPIGRRGDEMIRRLADRLAAVDLLDQATEILQYQVDHRLQGAARAQNATRLAMYYLMNRKPARAIRSASLKSVGRSRWRSAARAPFA